MTTRNKEEPLLIKPSEELGDDLRALINAFGSKGPDEQEELRQDWGDAKNSMAPKKENWGDAKNFIGEGPLPPPVEVKKAGRAKKPSEFKPIHVAPEKASETKKDVRPGDDDDMKRAQEDDARALQFIGLGRMLDRAGQELAGMKPDLSYHDNAERVHANKTKNLGARREEGRKQEDQDFARGNARRLEQKHKTEQDQHSSTSPEAIALQKFAVENKILSPEQAKLLTPEVWAEVMAGKNFLQAIREKSLDRQASLKEAEIRSSGKEDKYSEAWNRQVALNEEIFKDKKGQRVLADWEPIPEADGTPMVVPQQGLEKFRDSLGQAEYLKRILADIRVNYSKKGAEWFFGQEYETMKSEREAAHQAIQKMLGNGVMSAGDKASLNELFMDPNSIRSKLTSTTTKDFLASLDGIERRTEQLLHEKGRSINLRRRGNSIDINQGSSPAQTNRPDWPANGAPAPAPSAPAQGQKPQQSGQSGQVPPDTNRKPPPFPDAIRIWNPSVMKFGWAKPGAVPPGVSEVP